MTVRINLWWVVLALLSIVLGALAMELPEIKRYLKIASM
jgi:hypothetical protein